MTGQDGIDAARSELQEAMTFLSALAAGVEQVVGGPANGMAFVAGKTLGRRLAASARKTEELQEALAETARVLEAHDCRWRFEPFQPSTRPELVSVDAKGDPEILLVFRDCMIRQSLFRFGHPQKGSLCCMMYGAFSGALEVIMGARAELQIVHAGPNACLKRLSIRGGRRQEGSHGA